MRRMIPAVVIGSLFSGQVVAAPVTTAQVQRAQADTMNRVGEAVNRYAQSIKIDHEYVNYCYGELNFRTSGQPKDGAIPYGVSYLEITDSDRLATVLSVRETYERSFLILCLANAKNALRDASKP